MERKQLAHEANANRTINTTARALAVAIKTLRNDKSDAQRRAVLAARDAMKATWLAMPKIERQVVKGMYRGLLWSALAAYDR